MSLVGRGANDLGMGDGLAGGIGLERASHDDIAGVEALATGLSEALVDSRGVVATTARRRPLDRELRCIRLGLDRMREEQDAAASGAPVARARLAGAATIVWEHLARAQAMLDNWHREPAARRAA